MAGEEVERILRLATTLAVAERMKLIQELAAGVAYELGSAKVEPKAQRVVLSTDQLTYEIVGNAMAVHRAKGSGYRENTYQRDLEIHFAESEI